MWLSVFEPSAESRCCVDPERKPGLRLQEPDSGLGPDPDLALGQWVSSGEFSVRDDFRNAITVAKGFLTSEARSAEVLTHTPFVVQLFDLDRCAQRLSHMLPGVWSQQDEEGPGGQTAGTTHRFPSCLVVSPRAQPGSAAPRGPCRS